MGPEAPGVGSGSPLTGPPGGFGITGGDTQIPFSQWLLPPQTWPHAPQFALSLEKSTQAPAQLGVVHVGVQHASVET